MWGSVRMLELKMSDIPWWALQGAYGASARVPSILKDLVADDEETRSEAIRDGLFAHITQAETVYPVTPYAVYFVGRLLDHPKCVVQRELLRFLRACAEQDGQILSSSPLHSVLRQLRGIPRVSIRASIMANRDRFGAFAADEDEGARADAAWLTAYCAGLAPATHAVASAE